PGPPPACPCAALPRPGVSVLAVPSAPVRIRVSVVGLGMVGAWLLEAIDRHRDRLRDEYGLVLSVVALAGRRDGFVYREEGIEIASRHRAGFRAESTVMSGTPVLAALTTGLGGARPVRLRGVLNATVNLICSRIAAGGTYEEALAEAQAAGLAEPDPSADVDGF